MSDRLCSFCIKQTPATHRCQCSDARCQVYACAAHRHLTSNPALIPSAAQGGK